MIYLLLCLAVAVFSYGYSFALWQRTWPNLNASAKYLGDMFISFTCSMLWPVMIPVTLVIFKDKTRWQGLKFW